MRRVSVALPRLPFVGAHAETLILFARISPWATPERTRVLRKWGRALGESPNLASIKRPRRASPLNPLAAGGRFSMVGSLCMQ